MTQRIRIGVIGCGQIAQQHLATYAAMPEVELVACADLNAAAAQKSAAEYRTMLISEGIYLSEALGREVTAEEIVLHSRAASS